MKAKLMLVAIAVFATVGGLVAFKAQTYNLGRYCTTSVAGNKCDQFLLAAKTAVSGAKVFYTTTTGSNCGSTGIVCEEISTTIVSE